MMVVKDFLAPTRGRIVLFLIMFILILVYDTALTPFPDSPIIESITTQAGAMTFVLYILFIPYILSCIIPAFMGMRHKRYIRLTNLTEFMQPRPRSQQVKSSNQQTFTFPTGTPVVASHLEGNQDQSLDAVETASLAATIKGQARNAKGKSPTNYISSAQPASAARTTNQTKPQKAPTKAKPAAMKPKPAKKAKPVSKKSSKSKK